MKKFRVSRKFLLKQLPHSLLGVSGVPILQGYVANDEHREVCIRQLGRKHFLSVKERSAPLYSEVEIPISAAQFSALWPSTVGRRLEKSRIVLKYGAHLLELDRYEGDLAALMIGEVEFFSREESACFIKPPYFGAEVTDDSGYRNLALAIHGAPQGAALKYEIGALPYLFRANRLYVVIVTNSAQTRWIIPKGQPEPDMSRQDVAIMEAMEEAGVIGAFHSGLRGECRRKGEKTLHVYPIKVSTLLKKWPEMGSRRRMLVPVSKALKMISDAGLAQCVQRLALKLED